MAEIKSDPCTRSIGTTPLAQFRPIAWWLKIFVIAGALLMAMGAVIALVNPAMLVSTHDEINGAVHVYAGYFAARNLALTIMLFALLMAGARRALANLMVLVALIQLLDFGMDLAEGRWAVAPGVLAFGVAFIMAANRLIGNTFWKTEFWTG